MAYYVPPYQSEEPLDETLMVFACDPEFSSNVLSFWEFIQENTSYRAVWFIRDPEVLAKLQASGMNIELYEWGSEKSQEIYAKAKYFITENLSPHEAYKKPQGQLVIQLRSTLSLYSDYFAFQSSNDYMHNHVLYNKLFSSMTDMYTANSELFRVIGAGVQFADARKFYVTGMPRLDTFLHSPGKKILLKALPQLAQYDKLIGYFPTTKLSLDELNGEPFNRNPFNLNDFDAEKLDSILKQHNAAVVYKLHHSDECKTLVPEMAGIREHFFKIDSSSLLPKGLYHVLNAFDLMITDCSSLANEYLLLDRPILFNCADADKLIIQPMITDRDTLQPGIRFNNMQGLCDGIEKSFANPGEYSEQRNRVKHLFHKYEDGYSSQRVLTQMEKIEPFENLDWWIFSQAWQEHVNYVTQPLQDQLQQQTQALEAEQHALSALQTEHALLQAAHKHAKKAFAELEKAHFESSQAYEATAWKLNEMTNTWTQTQAELAQTQAELAQTQEELAQTQAVLTQTQTELMQMQTDLAQMHATLADIQSSRSYRFITKIAGFFRRLAMR